MKAFSIFSLANSALTRVLSVLIVLSVVLIVFIPTILSNFNASSVISAAIAEDSKSHVGEAYGRLPLSFVPNVGQAAEPVKFISQGNGYTLFLTSQEAVLNIKKTKSISYVDQQDIVNKLAKVPVVEATPSAQEETSTAIRLKLAGANSQPVVQSLEQQSGKSNYFFGADASQWRTNVANYGQVLYKEIYSGINLLYYGNQQNLEYDFVVAPGANYHNIQLNFAGIDTLSVNEQGDLVLKVADSQVVQRKPLIYQEVNQGRKIIEGKYQLKADLAGSNIPLVGFELQAYDPGLPLIIDPILDYSSYLGGNGSDEAFGIAVDSTGNAYISGTTTSTNFPSLGVQGTTHRSSDVFVLKLNSAGTALLYSTYLGGSGVDHGQRLAIDSSGNAYLTGDTNSSNFPTIPLNSTSLGGGTDAFVTKFNTTGDALVYSTYLGGSGNDEGNQVAVDSSGNAYVTGYTGSLTGLATNGAYQSSLKGSVDGYVAKLDTSGVKEYFTYLGGSSEDYGFSIAVGGTNDVYVAGATSSTDFPTLNPFRGYGGFYDAFVTRLTSIANSPTPLSYSVLLGGTGGDFAYSIAVDSGGNAYITGNTNSTDFYTLNALQSSSAGGFDAIVAKLNSSGGLVYSTYLGGSNYDQGNGIGVDSSGNAYITGQTYSAGFPNVNSIQLALRGTTDGFVTVINSAGTGLVYSTFLGGSNSDAGNFIAVSSTGTAYVTGSSSSNNFPTNNPLQASFAGGPFDAFVAKIRPDLNTIVVTATVDDGSGGTPGTLSYALIHATAYQTIVFQLSGGGNTINVHGQLPAPTNAHVIIDGGACGTAGIILDGSGTTADGLQVTNGVTVRNLTIKGFNGKRIVASGSSSTGGNLLLCVKAIR